MLKKIRKQNGFTQDELGIKIGKTRSSISRLESKSIICNPNVKLILRLSKELNAPRIDVFEYFADKIEKNK